MSIFQIYRGFLETEEDKIAAVANFQLTTEESAKIDIETLKAIKRQVPIWDGLKSREFVLKLAIASLPFIAIAFILIIVINNTDGNYLKVFFLGLVCFYLWCLFRQLYVRLRLHQLLKQQRLTYVAYKKQKDDGSVDRDN